MKTFETTRGRPVSIEAVPAFCPICGYELAGTVPPGEARDKLVLWHAEGVHPDRLGFLYALVRGAPAAKVRALLVTPPLGVDHGSDQIDVILLDRTRQGVSPQHVVETYDLNPPTGHSHPRYRWEYEHPELVTS